MAHSDTLLPFTDGDIKGTSVFGAVDICVLPLPVLGPRSAKAQEHGSVALCQGCDTVPHHSSAWPGTPHLSTCPGQGSV